MNVHVEQVFTNARKHEPRLNLEMVQDYFATKHTGTEILSHEVATLVHESLLLRATVHTSNHIRASRMDIMTVSQISRGSIDHLIELLDEKFNQ